MPNASKLSGLFNERTVFKLVGGGVLAMLGVLAHYHKVDLTKIDAAISGPPAANAVKIGPQTDREDQELFMMLEAVGIPLLLWGAENAVHNHRRNQAGAPSAPALL